MHRQIFAADDFDPFLDSSVGCVELVAAAVAAAEHGNC